MSDGASGLWGTGFALGILAALAGCAEAREREEPPVVYADVHPILEAKCAECHSWARSLRPTIGSRTTSRPFGAFPDGLPRSPPRCPPTQTAPDLGGVGASGSRAAR